MNRASKIKELTKRSASALERNKTIKMVQMVLILAFSILIVLDIMFELVPTFPTVSTMVRKASSSEYFVLIWLWGLIGARIFFPSREPNNPFSSIYGGLVILLLTFGFIVLGRYLNKYILSGDVKVSLLLLGFICGYFLWPSPKARTS